MNTNELKSQVSKDKIKFISYQFTDINGVVKSLDGPVEQLDEVLDNGIWFDGSSVEGFARIQESDMHLVPDPETYAMLPWTNPDYRRARILCDIHTQNDEPFEGDPRGKLKHFLAEVKKKHGWTLKVGPEPEFFLFLRNGSEKIHPVPYDVGGYFDFSANDQAVNVRTEIMSTLRTMGLDVEVGHHECGLGQHEIDFRFDEALRTADNVQTFKTAVKAIAAKNGLIASFMPKPTFGAPGSGMHCHQSIHNDAGKNLFYDEVDPMHLSKLAHSYIAGQLAHATAMSAILAPTVNSYKRLVPGYEAPVYVGWAQLNRSALIRIPKTQERNHQAVRIELRCPDPSANPYLAFLAMFAAGVDGILNDTPLPKPLNNLNVYELTPEERAERQIEMLPGSLKEAVDLFETDQVIRQALGEDLTDKFINARMAEWEEYRMSVSDWEVARYLEAI
ncbi:MAG: type I glutamate--ammonia ligase [Anaerolineaceae bacterium]